MHIDTRMLREITGLAVPVIVGMISYTVLNLVDTAMVGRLGDEALGSVGLGSFFVLVMVLVFGSLSVGTQALTSRRLGEDSVEELPRIAYNAFFLSFIVGVAVSVVGYSLSPWIFSMLSDDPVIVETGTPYLAIRSIGLFSMVVIFTLRGYVWGLARARIDTIVSVAINILNIVLNWFLIFGHWIFPRLEVKGAAIASTISTVFGLALYIALVHRRVLMGNPSHDYRIGLSRRIMWQITRISAPRTVQAMSVIGFITFLSFIGRIGVAPLAISNIIFKAFNMAFMVGLAVGTASATLVGRSLGERNERLAERYGWYSAAMGALAMGAIGALFMFFPRQIMGMFTTNASTIEIGVVPFRLLGAFQAIDGVGIVLARSLQGAGYTLFVMIVETICVWGVFIPFTYLAVEVWKGGTVAVWWGLFIYIVLFAAANAWKFREGGWKRVKI